jgi:sugar lactone lactonase YvrE
MTYVGVEVALAVGAELAEGPVWDAERNVLWWVDIFAGNVHCFDPTRGVDRSYHTPGTVGSLATRTSGGLLLARRDGLYGFSPEDGTLVALNRPEPERQQNRFNDGKTDRQGRYWAGSLHDDEVLPTGALYRLDTDHSCHREVDGIFASNGTAFSPDGRTGYHADSHTGLVWQFDCDPLSGALSNRGVFVEVDLRAGAPDGATCDIDGCYWLTRAGGWRLERYTPEGRIDRVIQLPVEIPTCPAFGGRDGRTLYLTTATYQLSCEARALQPLAGHILALDVGVGGLPDTPYGG